MWNDDDGAVFIIYFLLFSADASLFVLDHFLLYFFHFDVIWGFRGIEPWQS